jgi:alkylation response protein AidB-like acyl-CoA dehydrogenase
MDERAIGEGWVRPTLLAAGTDQQQARWLPGIEDGTAIWCQLFSEPDAGSDLASLRTTAERDGDVYVVNGQKIWSTWANHADWGILLARTDPSAPKHKGISYFALDMREPGVEVRPLVEMTGGNHFNEVFFTDVRVPLDCRVGDEGDGWRLAGITLANERVALSEGGVLWGMGPTGDDLFTELRARGGVDDPVLRQRAARVYEELVVLRLLGGRPDGPASSLRKTLGDEHGQHVMALMKDLQGAHGMLGEQRPDSKETDVWHWGYLFSRALTIGGGTSEVQRNIIGERLLGLPR